MNLQENIKLALRSIRGNWLRTALTVMIISFGIMALVGILTSIDSIEGSISSQFSNMGANTFTIRRGGFGARMTSGGQKRKRYTKINYQQASNFKNSFVDYGEVSMSYRASGIATLKYQSKKTDPNVTVFGVDVEYLNVMGMQLTNGRNISMSEMNAASNVMLMGSDAYRKLFGPKDSVLGKSISVGNIKYKLVGILEPKGASVVSSDNMILIPLSNARRNYRSSNPSFVLSVAVNSPDDLDMSVADATGIMRNVRGLKPGSENDFDIVRSDRLASMMIDQLKYVSMATIIIGIVTLLGAAIGLMNIMLVSVTERTREIGVTKAIGATRREILIQFLTEAVVICQIGGFVGGVCIQRGPMLIRCLKIGRASCRERV